MKKLLLLFTLFLFFTQGQAQTCYIEIDGNNLYASANNDCNGSNDNRWRMRVRSSATGVSNDWNVDADNNGNGGWSGYTNGAWADWNNTNWVTNIEVYCGGCEVDGFTCGGDDGCCYDPAGGGVRRNIYVPSYAPNTWYGGNNSTFETGRTCNSDGSNMDWYVRLSFRYYFISGMSPGSIGGSTTVCSGGAVTLTNVSNPTDWYNNLLWEQAQWNGSSYNAYTSTGQTGLTATFNPTVRTKYRRRAQWVVNFSGGVGGTVYTNEQEVFVDYVTTANAGADQDNCSTSATFAGNTPTSGTGTWSVVSGCGSCSFSNANATNNVVSNLSPNASTFRWTLNNGVCADSQDDVIITSSRLTTSAAGADQDVCATSTTLAANTPTTGVGTWTVVGGCVGCTFSNANSGTSTVSNLPVGTNTLRWTLPNGTCADSQDDVVIIRSISTTPNAGADQDVCATSATLAANTPTTGVGTWTIVGGCSGCTFSNANSPSSTVDNMPAGANTLRWTLPNGSCTDLTDDVVITRSVFTTADAGADVAICDVTNTNLAANTPTTGVGTWSVVSGCVGCTWNVNLPAANVANIPEGTHVFRWTLPNGTCADSQDDVTIVRSVSAIANAGTDQAICDATSTALAGNTPGTGVGTWTVVSGCSGCTFSNANSGTSNLNSIPEGTHQLRWTLPNGSCADSQDDVVIVRSVSTTANAGTDIDICDVTSTTLAGNTPATGVGTWTIINCSGCTFSNPNSPTSTISNLPAGTSTVRWSMLSGSCADTQDDVSIVRNVTTTAAAGTDQAICDATTTNLAGNTPVTGVGTWTIVSGCTGCTFANANSPTSALNSIPEGVNTLRWSLPNGSCTDSQDDVVVTRSVSTTAAAGTDQNICDVTTVTLAGNTPVTGVGTWTIVSGCSGCTFSDANSPTSSLNSIPAGTNTVRWNLPNGSCTDSQDDVTIVRSVTTVANAGTDQAICDVSSATLAANTPVTGVGTWSIVSGCSGCSFANANSPTSTVNSMPAGTHTLRWSLPNGTCADSQDDVVIVRSVTTTANAGVDQTICDVTSATLAGNSPVTGVGTWTIVSGCSGCTFSDANSPTATLSSIPEGVNTIRWSLPNGSCTDSQDDVNITRSVYTVANAGPDQPNICDATSTTLAGNTPATGVGTWAVVSGCSGCTFSNPNSPTATLNNIPEGTSTIRWILPNGTCADSNDDMVLTRSVYTAANAGPDQPNICTSTTAFLAANTPVTGIGTWSIVSGCSGCSFGNINSSASSLNNIPEGVNTVRWTFLNGTCADSYDDVTLTRSVYTVANAGPDQPTICDLSSIPLAGNTPGTGVGQWSVVSGCSGCTFSDANSPTSTVDNVPEGTATLRWFFDNGSCTDSQDDVVITRRVSSTAPTSATGTTLICNGTSTSLSVVGGSLGTGASWKWYAGGCGTGTAVATGATVSLSPSVTTTYYVRAEGICNTTACASITVTVQALPNLVITDPTPVCDPATIDITAPGVAVDANNTIGTLTYWPTLADAVASTNPMPTPAVINLTGTYYIKKTTTVNSCVDIKPVYAEVNNCQTLTWTGAVSTDWNDLNNWDPSVVPTYTNIIIVPDVANDPSLTTGPVGNFESATIAAGATINIGAGKSITAWKNWTGSSTVQTGAGKMIFGGNTGTQVISGGATFSNLVIKNASGVTVPSGFTNLVNVSQSLQLQQGLFTTNNNVTMLSTASQQSYIDDFSPGFTGTSTGFVKMQRYVSQGLNGFRYIGAPVNNFGGMLTLGSMTGFVANGIPGQVIPLPTCDPNFTALGSPYGSLMYWNESGPFTVPGCKQSGWYFTITGGLTLGRGYGAKLSPGTTITYIGSPNTGTISYGALGNTTAEGNGWHLVANPYPSPIKVSNVDANPSNNMPAGFQGQIQFFQPNGPYTGTYQAVNTGITDAEIGVGQGFWVQTPSSGTWTMTQGHRTTGDPTYYTSPVLHHLLVNVSGNGYMDKTDINFVPAATNGFDFYDANKWEGRAAQPTLYTKIGEEKSAINSMPSLDEVVAVPMGFKPGTAGSYTLNFDFISSFPASTMIYLEDTKLGTMSNLRLNNNYAFTSALNDNVDRFIIHFQPGVSTSVENPDCNNPEDGSIEFTQPAPTVWASYDVKDNAGNIYAQGTNFTGSILVTGLTAQEYILTLNHASGYTAQEFVTLEAVDGIQTAITASATNVNVDEPVTLTAEGDNVTEYVWTFGDGNVEVSTTNTTVHSFDMAGVYSVIVTASNDNCIDVASKVINVNNTATGINGIKAEDLIIYGYGDMLVVEFNNWGENEANIAVYNALGQQVGSFTGVSTLKGRQQMNIADVKPGYYFVQVVSGGQVIGKKVYLGSNN